jgi:hypothetical protein
VSVEWIAAAVMVVLFGYLLIGLSRQERAARERGEQRLAGRWPRPSATQQGAAMQTDVPGAGPAGAEARTAKDPAREPNRGARVG